MTIPQWLGFYFWDRAFGAYNGSVTGGDAVKEISFTYDSNTRTVPGRKGGIQVENLVPQLPDEERTARRRGIKDRLFEVFVRYAEGRK